MRVFLDGPRIRKYLCVDQALGCEEKLEVVVESGMDEKMREQSCSPRVCAWKCQPLTKRVEPTETDADRRLCADVAGPPKSFLKPGRQERTRLVGQ